MTAPREVRGRIVWWDIERGFGFVQSAELDREAFIHARTLPAQTTGPRTPDMTGVLVRGLVALTPRGPRFIRVDDVDPPRTPPARAWRGVPCYLAPSEGTAPHG